MNTPGRDTRRSVLMHPKGYCECGCGEQTPLAKETKRADGRIKGQPMRFIKGHNRRKTAADYVVADGGYATPCWIWQRALNSSGYGLCRRGTQTVAHRVYYEAQHGPIAPGLTLEHLCGNRACVNPDHLEPMTQAQNCRLGGGTKLTAKDVAFIRSTPTAAVVLAAKFDVSQSTICDIRAGRTWVAS